MEYQLILVLTSLSHFAWVTTGVVYQQTNANLTEFPDVPSDTTHIILSKNSITVVPAEKLNHVTLTDFTMSKNQLTEIPSFPLNSATTLETLDLHKNQISTINATALNLMISLQYLGLHGNEIHTWPTVNMPSLLILQCGQNHIANISTDALMYMPGLVRVFFYDNQITEVPNMDYIQPQTMLQLEANLIYDFPNLTVHGQFLKTLHLHGNQISVIPTSFLNPLVKLEYLNLRNNNLTTIPNVPGPGESLTTLQIGSNPLISMPPLDKLGKSLEYLAVRYTPQITSAKNMLFGMPNLTFIYLCQVGINELPSLTHLQQDLDTLDISELRDLMVSPIDMAMIGKFTTVVMTKTTFARSPASVCNVKEGASLDIQYTVGLDVCSCEMAWLKIAAQNGLNVLQQTGVCNGMAWSDLTLAAYMEQCEWQEAGQENVEPLAGKFMVTYL